MKRIYFLMTILAAMLVLSCEQVKDWSEPTDGDAPAPITNPQVENLNGGARITYTLPADKDLLGVKAVYSLDDGELRESFASAATDTITLEGYGSVSKQYTVMLYAMDKSRNESVPVSVSIEPLMPPVDLLRQTLNVQQAFAGVFLNWENTFGKEIAITLYAADSTGFLEYYDTYYTSAQKGSTSFRGFDDTERNFRIEIRDRWHNYAAPFDTVIKPLREVNIFGRDETNSTIWEMYGLVNDLYKYMGNIPNSNWAQFTDGVGYGPYTQLVNWNTHYFSNVTTQDHWSPFYITIDMKKTASYSRFKYWMGNRSPIGSAATLWGFSLWGTNNPKPVDIAAGQIANLQYWTGWGAVPGTDIVVNGTDEWMNDWEKLGEYRLVMPSGATSYVAGQVTAEDQAFIQEGFEFDIDPAMTSKPFRYLRFKVDDGGIQWMLPELQFFGNFTEE
jgi:hypothetical protein